jgi:sigma-B regulation protein RsbU (phosphoserine phosphatase)
MSSRFMLPGSASDSPPGVLARVKGFLLQRWLGRILLLCLTLFTLTKAGVPLPAFVGLPNAVILLLYATWGFLRLLAWMSQRFVWRIRTKLILSYLFIAVVPLVLLVAFFAGAGILFSGLVASHMVVSEVHRQGEVLQDVARTALAGLPLDSPPADALLEKRLSAAEHVHRKFTYVLSVKKKFLRATGDGPRTLPGWWTGPGFAGLVKTESGASVLRAVWSEGDAYLALDAPLDESFFAEIREKTGVELLAIRGEGDKDEPEIRLQRGPPGPGSRQLSGWPGIATTERTHWATGRSDLEFVVFQYQPSAFAKRLVPGRAGTADILVTVLAVIGVIFLVMYCFALLLGLLLARSITKSVHALYLGTQSLRAGDFQHRIRVTSRDQLGELAGSFNDMAQGLQDLMREQAEKQRLEEELRIARQIQMSLLPAETVTLPGLRIAALCLPAAEVGGDYYDLLPLSPTRLGVLVADVSGKGTSAALYMAELKGLVLSLSRIHESPARLLGEANRILSANMDSRSFVTMTYAVVDAVRGSMRYARAGHNPLIHFDAAAGRTRLLTPPGLGLGLDKQGDQFEQILEEAEVPMGKGDVFLFFTDGLSEAMNTKAELFGEDRLRGLLEQSESWGTEEIKEHILAGIRAFVGEAAQHDDMTLVLLKVA